MCDCSTISWWLAAWRALHFLACLLPVGLLAFHLLVAAPVFRVAASPSRATCLIIFVSLIVALVSGIAWLLVVAGNIGDVTPMEAWRNGVTSAVFHHTHFGACWRLRAVFWIVAVAASLGMVARERVSTTIAWICLVAAAALLGALAWAGHGLDGDGIAARFHVVADAVHLVVSGVWPFGLAPFAAALLMLRKKTDSSRWNDTSALTRRFSAVALICVGLLTLTGLVNSWFMLPSVSSLWRSGYGRVLSVKILLFAGMVVLAAVNRLAFRPRLAAGDNPEATVRRLQQNVLFELVLGIAVILIVALLGLLSPPML
jgi:putative copper resistance protein D